ncbi:MAG: hypothetical protein A2015_11365 [Spirochaetes bacterium GWF1_31_7]|nr:MAG: hypothetical protein A2Y30_15710 [Spirochaetes bacterium GWE1_32_154]OHD49021.1 MAG: hypothetical protein A2015_11365 [Spirochaetes bacterium GWF1_31_7]OHD50394.1 MAG: hypothetical protein A2Y29_13760 [Spirochaetes bacterium GWE2_31_10]OHD75712.1 MAG: hypothetical protein A2355_00370 [Spirochaetes bacterium RIFOXYB1_FULL_32_8]HBD93816.1 hypothetical protein [Spirochaetia bacterium]
MDIKTNGRNNVLIVDDTLENIKVLGTILMEEGFIVSVAQSGKEAIEIINKKLPNIILLDISMKEMDGIETCNRIKNDPSKKSIPIIFLTAHTELEYKKKAFSAGGVDYITKPFQKEEVLARVKTHLEMEAYRNYLEQEISIRTKELQIANKSLEVEIIKTKQAEEVLLQSQKMETVGTLAGGLAHDLNNILSGITGAASIIKYKIENHNPIENDKLLNYMETISHACSRASTLINQLLSLSRKQDIKYDIIDLNKIMKTIIEIIETSLDKTIEIIPLYYSAAAFIKGNSAQIEQVLLNLAINAAHAMTIMRPPEEKKGGKLTISLKKIITDKYFCDKYPSVKQGEYFVFSLKDTGVGIDKSIIQRIFNPFFTTKKEFIGTGLGLAISYNIIDKHSGIIDVYSEQKVGSEFSVYLPALIDNKSENLNLDVTRKIEKDTGKILVIDDEQVIRETLKEILEEIGYEIDVAENGYVAIEFYKKNVSTIKAIILNLNMPELSGKEIYEELKKINNCVKVFILTGFQFDDRLTELFELGVIGTIEKPFTLYNVYDVLHKQL